MGSWDELCLVCGASPSGGPIALLHRVHIEKTASEIAAEVKEEITDIAEEQLVEIVKEALASSFSEHDRTLGYRPVWLPDETGQRADLTEAPCCAIGYFNDDGDVPVRDGKIPDGRFVEARAVRNCVGGDFSEVVQTSTEAILNPPPVTYENGPDSDGVELEPEILYQYSSCSVAVVNHPHNPNFWTCIDCIRRLWLYTRDVVDRTPSPNCPEGWFSQLYEVINSRLQHRTEIDTGLLPWIDYEGIEKTLEQWQSHFVAGRRGSRHVARGVRSGVRGQNLIPALMRDFRCWMFTRPDRWPSPTQDAPTFTTFADDIGPSPTIATVPFEILFLFCHMLDLGTMLELSGTCKTLRNLLTEPNFLRQVLKDSMRDGNLCYLRPLEEERVDERAIAKEWLDSAGLGQLDIGTSSSFSHPNFPYLRFVSACLRNDSMRNRRRIWGVMGKIREVWLKYQDNGWEVDRFYPSSLLSDDFISRAVKSG